MRVRRVLDSKLSLRENCLKIKKCQNLRNYRFQVNCGNTTLQLLIVQLSHQSILSQKNLRIKQTSSLDLKRITKPVLSQFTCSIFYLVSDLPVAKTSVIESEQFSSSQSQSQKQGCYKSQARKHKL